MPTDDELLQTYRAAVDAAKHEAYVRDGFGSNRSRESTVAGLRAVFEQSSAPAEESVTEAERLVQIAQTWTPGEVSASPVGASRVIQALRTTLAESIPLQSSTPTDCEADERVQAWEIIAEHPAFKSCYSRERPLIYSVVDRLNGLVQMEEAVNELAPDPAPTDQDEREALRDALVAGERKSRSTGGSASGLYSAQADAILAAGFRRTPAEHPAHSGHRYGGGYARAAALAAGDPDWQNATGGTTEHPEPPSDAEKQRDGYLADLQHVQAERNVAEAKLARIADALRSNERSSVRVSMSLAILNDKEAD